MTPAPVTDIAGARVLAMLGDSVTTDHISPAGSIGPTTPAGRYLIEHGVERQDFNSYGARRGNHEVMMRGTFANVRLRNLLAPGTEGGVTLHLPDGEEMSIYDAAMHYAAEGVPLVVLAGREYGTGSSRDWAAKGTALLGVRAVIAQSFERIHRSNLIGMGVLPLQFYKGDSAQGLGLTGHERFSIAGLDVLNKGELPKELHRHRGRRRRLGHRVPGHRAHRHPDGGGVLPPRRHPAVRAAPDGGLSTRLSRLELLSAPKVICSGGASRGRDRLVVKAAHDGEPRRTWRGLDRGRRSDRRSDTGRCRRTSHPDAPALWAERSRARGSTVPGGRKARGRSS